MTDRQISDPLSHWERLLRRIVLFWWSPIPSISTRIAVTIVFVSELPETARKWWFILIFLFVDLIIGIIDVLRRIPRWLHSWCRTAIDVLGRWMVSIGRVAEHADRIFDERDGIGS